jgi:hypothetical protein
VPVASVPPFAAATFLEPGVEPGHWARAAIPRIPEGRADPIGVCGTLGQERGGPIFEKGKDFPWPRPHNRECDSV